MKKLIFLSLLFSFLIVSFHGQIKGKERASAMKEKNSHNFTKRKEPQMIPIKATKKVVESQLLEKRFFDSNVYVYISSSEEKLAITLGKRGLEKLSDIHMHKEVAKINGGMFNPSGGEHGGLFLSDGAYLNAPSSRYISAVLLKDGTLDIRHYSKEITKKEIASLKKEAILGIGTTYSLVQDGQVNLQNAEVFSHSSQNHPRSLFGQTRDGRFIFVAVDGRQKGSKGVTAKESAEIMLSLGAKEAVNLDGGGSTTLIVNDTLINQPSDGRPRVIGSALFLLK